MGKIRIVRRRKREDQIRFTTTESTDLYVLERRDLEDFRASNGTSLAWRPPLPEDYVGSDYQKFTMELTPTQSEVVKSHACFKLLLGAGADGSNVQVERSEDSKIVFNFHFKQVYFARMLTRSDVCTMLQISKTSLSKLVRTGTLTSYKIGRLRRFSLEDVLARLSESKEVLLKGEDQCTMNTGA